LILTIGVAAGAYKGLRELEKSEEKEKMIPKVTSALPAPIVEKREGEYKIGDVSGKAEGEALSKYFSNIVSSKTGGKTTTKPIPGRERFAFQDIMTGRLAKYNSYLDSHPEISNEPPEVQAALFERDVLGKKVDIEAIKKAKATSINS
jgi:hypothetical protein